MRRKKLTKTSPLLILLPFLLSIATAIDVLTPDHPLSDNKTLISASGTFAFGFFTPSPTSKDQYLGIWYNKVSIQTVVWVANRNHPIPATVTASLSIAANATLIVSDNNSTVIWSSAATTRAVANPIAKILDTGNFVVGDAGSSPGTYAWQSFDYPTDTLLPGMKLGWDLTSGLNRNLTAWASLTDPSPGPYSMSMDTSGDPQFFLWAGPTRTWRSAPWNGVRFSGIPDMKTYSMFTFDFMQNDKEIYYQFHVKDPTVISRLIVNQTGSTQRLVWLDQAQTWNVFWFAPKDQCDSVSPCGSFGVCNLNESPICDCIQGFVPRNPSNWALRDGRDGCVRKTELDCRNQTDGFMTVSDAKLPDTSSSTVDMSLGLDQCRAKCLSNCSCTAYASADINGTGCLIWTADLTDLRVWGFGGQDLYVRLAATDLASTPTDQSQINGGQTKTIAIVTPIVLGILMLATMISCCCIRRKKRRLATLGTISLTSPYNYSGSESRDMELPLFGLRTITVATDNFSIGNKLGEGGFGPVFRGILEDGKEIAVKRLATTSVQGTDEFKNEMMLIAKLQHRNLVRLLGCCVQGEERMLIYEYMPNRSLDVFLFGNGEGTCLDWKTRYQIITGITHGLVYLHHDSRFRIIHRDLKASNILLDENMNPKISDFGMARIFGGDETNLNTRKVAGTYGYMSPEYVLEGIFSMKSDVFSFGVLILEIVSGKRNRGVSAFSPHLNLIAHAWNLWNEGRQILQLVDESIGHSFPTNEVLKCIKIGLLCVQERPEDRPLMSAVIQMLGSDIQSLSEPKKPGFAAKISPHETNPSAGMRESSTSYDMTLTLLEGR